MAAPDGSVVSVLVRVRASVDASDCRRVISFRHASAVELAEPHELQPPAKRNELSWCSHLSASPDDEKQQETCAVVTLQKSAGFPDDGIGALEKECRKPWEELTQWGVRTPPQAERHHQPATKETSKETLYKRGNSGKMHTFHVDGVLEETASQDDVFRQAGIPAALAALQGINSSLIVYGATGSGKTHTMFGPSEALQSLHKHPERGLLSRVCFFLFDRLREKTSLSPAFQFQCRATAVEIYCERLRDLFVASPPRGRLANPEAKTLVLREDPQHGVVVAGLTEKTIKSADDLLRVFRVALRRRRFRETPKNATSSRSHTVLSLHVDTRTIAKGTVVTSCSSLHLVDLAGAERQTPQETHFAVPASSLWLSSAAVNEKRKEEKTLMEEACFINKSLSALMAVISEAANRRNHGRTSGLSPQAFPASSSSSFVPSSSPPSPLPPSPSVLSSAASVPFSLPSLVSSSVASRPPTSAHSASVSLPRSAQTSSSAAFAPSSSVCSSSDSCVLSSSTSCSFNQSLHHVGTWARGPSVSAGICGDSGTGRQKRSSTRQAHVATEGKQAPLLRVRDSKLTFLLKNALVGTAEKSLGLSESR
ncbi:kinesin motor domain-containing protein [Toxoplasma gondii FOU]|uniref:Kinesin-like protein n=3 Tax=Toxoplasma gondii TaxID=5811 RepID=A0A086LIC0_TOXGO|nr:kinesin motor domain-containing protein [Toxoplasma gondii FOU]PUA86661.1 kinesin motor domain-containing protein [Toxoplasma gondii TgCATBr9]